MPRYVAVLLLIGGVVGLFFAGGAWVAEFRVARVYEPAGAIIESAQAPGLEKGASVGISPVIHYRYIFKEKYYESTRIWVTDARVDAEAARTLLQQFRAGKNVTAYADPSAPGEAVLLRTPFVGPYWGLAGAIAAVAVAAGSLLGIVFPWKQRMRAPPLDPAEPNGWHTLLPSRQRRDTVREKAFLIVFIGLPTVLLAIQFVFAAHAAGSSGAPTWIFPAMAFALVWVQLFQLAWAQRLLWAIGDPSLVVRPAPLQRGEPFFLRLEIETRRRLDTVNLEVRIICRESYIMHLGRRTMLATRVLGEQTITLERQGNAAAGATILGEGECRFDPARWPPSGRAGSSTFPQCRWEVCVNLTGSQKRSTVFPIDAV